MPEFLKFQFFFCKDSGKLLYPSVTFCPKYTWKTFPGVSKIVLKIYRCIKSKTLHKRPPVKGLSFYKGYGPDQQK